MKFIILFIIAILAAVYGCHGKEIQPNIPLPAKFIAAEIQVESGGKDNAVGDNGKAIGCLQIHRPCWIDANMKGDYTNCFNRAYSIKVMENVLNRYCRDAIKRNDFETLARTWNGGVRGAKKQSTLSYWHKVQAAMKAKEKS